MGVLIESGTKLKSFSSNSLRQVSSTIETRAQALQTSAKQTKECLCATIDQTGITSKKKLASNFDREYHRIIGAIYSNLESTRSGIQKIKDTAAPVYSKVVPIETLSSVSSTVTSLPIVTFPIHVASSAKSTAYDLSITTVDKCKDTIDYLIHCIINLLESLNRIESVVWSKKQMRELHGLVIDGLEKLLEQLYPLVNTYVNQPINMVHKSMVNLGIKIIETLRDMRNNLVTAGIFYFEVMDDKYVTPVYEFSEMYTIKTYNSAKGTVINVNNSLVEGYELTKSGVNNKVIIPIHNGIEKTKSGVNNKIIVPVNDKIVNPVITTTTNTANAIKTKTTETATAIKTRTTETAVSVGTCAKNTALQSSAWLDYKLSLSGWLWMAVAASRKVDKSLSSKTNSTVTIESKVVKPVMNKVSGKLEEWDNCVMNGKVLEYVEDISKEYISLRNNYEDKGSSSSSSDVTVTDKSLGVTGSLDASYKSSPLTNTTSTTASTNITTGNLVTTNADSKIKIVPPIKNMNANGSPDTAKPVSSPLMKSAMNLIGRVVNRGKSPTSSSSSGKVSMDDGMQRNGETVEVRQSLSNSNNFREAGNCQSVGPMDASEIDSKSSVTPINNYTTGHGIITDSSSSSNNGGNASKNSDKSSKSSDSYVSPSKAILFGGSEAIINDTSLKGGSSSSAQDDYVSTDSVSVEEEIQVKSSPVPQSNLNYQSSPQSEQYYNQSISSPHQVQQNNSSPYTSFNPHFNNYQNGYQTQGTNSNAYHQNYNNQNNNNYSNGNNSQSGKKGGKRGKSNKKGKQQKQSQNFNQNSQ